MRDPAFAAGGVVAYTGDVLEVLAEMADGSVDCVVTSPPYWNLRDYGTVGQLGLEADPFAYVAHMVTVFREVRRVLAKTGTCFVNIGDTYAASRCGPIGDRSGLDGGQSSQKASRMALNGIRGNKPNRRQHYGVIKNKDLCLIPFRLAIALQEDGWWIRSDIVWSKPNPMPSSVEDRPAKSHEYVLMLAKAERYFWNGEAIQEPLSLGTHLRMSQHVAAQLGSKRANGGQKANGPMKAVVRSPKVQDGHSDGYVANNASMIDGGGRNARSVWTIPTESYTGAHYATFPRELARRCILAGCPPAGTVLDPFVGSGTTLAVCVQLERAGIGIDIDPKNVRQIERRVGEAVLERSRGDGDGRIEAVAVSDLGPLWENVGA